MCGAKPADNEKFLSRSFPEQSRSSWGKAQTAKSLDTWLKRNGVTGGGSLGGHSKPPPYQLRGSIIVTTLASGKGLS